ncbi:hypothetical protein Tco_1263147 [Tanacetum coccineum]
MQEYNALVADVKSRMRRDDVRRVARNPVTWDELEVNGNERAYDTGRFIRYPSVGDGNCSFRSYSQAIAGHQGLHVVFRKGTEARMRAHPHLYKPRNMRLDEYRRYLANQVGVVGTPVGMNVAQAAADLLRVRMIRTYAKYPQVIGEITPLGGRFFYEINLGNIPGHVDTLARSHLYPYHLQGMWVYLTVYLTMKDMKVHCSRGTRIGGILLKIGHCHLVLDVGIELSVAARFDF